MWTSNSVLPVPLSWLYNNEHKHQDQSENFDFAMIAETHGKEYPIILMISQADHAMVKRHIPVWLSLSRNFVWTFASVVSLCNYFAILVVFVVVEVWVKWGIVHIQDCFPCRPIMSLHAAQQYTDSSAVACCFLSLKTKYYYVIAELLDWWYHKQKT